MICDGTTDASLLLFFAVGSLAIQIITIIGWGKIEVRFDA